MHTLSKKLLVRVYGWQDKRSILFLGQAICYPVTLTDIPIANHPIPADTTMKSTLPARQTRPRRQQMHDVRVSQSARIIQQTLLLLFQRRTSPLHSHSVRLIHSLVTH
jgi:hypothetical protein